jgi:thioredoxin 1
MEYLTNQTFKERIFNYEENKDWKFEGELPCIIDFYADWCGPCKMVSPILETLQKEYEGKINIYKIDTDKEAELSSVFGIRSIPSLDRKSVV